MKVNVVQEEENVGKLKKTIPRNHRNTHYNRRNGRRGYRGPHISFGNVVTIIVGVTIIVLGVSSFHHNKKRLSGEKYNDREE